MATGALATVKIDNDRVRVTEWHFPGEASTGYHRHAYDYIVVPMTTGRLRMVGPGGESHADLVAGQPYARPAGVEHDVVNPGPAPFTFIEIELK